MKKNAPSASGRHATWDEGNLARNEDIKAELNPTKIDEPKTPYHAPVDPDVGAHCRAVVRRQERSLNFQSV